MFSFMSCLSVILSTGGFLCSSPPPICTGLQLQPQPSAHSTSPRSVQDSHTHIPGPTPLDTFKLVQIGPHRTGTILPSDMFKLMQNGSHCKGTNRQVQSVQPGPHFTGTPAPDMFKFVHSVAQTVNKQTVGIRMKCLLVIWSFKLHMKKLHLWQIWEKWKLSLISREAWAIFVPKLLINWLLNITEAFIHILSFLQTSTTKFVNCRL